MGFGYLATGALAKYRTRNYMLTDTRGGGTQLGVASFLVRIKYKAILNILLTNNLNTNSLNIE